MPAEKPDFVPHSVQEGLNLHNQQAVWEQRLQAVAEYPGQRDPRLPQHRPESGLDHPDRFSKKPTKPFHDDGRSS